MELLLIRYSLLPLSTRSTFTVNGEFECYILEDTDRGLTQKMSIEEIKKIKIHSKTAIPTGRYRITISFSQKFKMYLPELHDVPGFAGIRIHSGNKVEDTEGCLLTGTTHVREDKNYEVVLNSRAAFKILMSKLLIAEKKEEIWITIS